MFVVRLLLNGFGVAFRTRARCGRKSALDSAESEKRSKVTVSAQKGGLRAVTFTRTPSFSFGHYLWLLPALPDIQTTSQFVLHIFCGGTTTSAFFFLREYPFTRRSRRDRRLNSLVSFIFNYHEEYLVPCFSQRYLFSTGGPEHR